GVLYSAGHRVYTAGDAGDGWVVGDDGTRLHWALDDYAEEGLREQRWFVDGVRKYHRTIATLLNGLVDAGLTIERVVEPVPSAEALQRRPEFIDERRRPPFLLVRARKA